MEESINSGLLKLELTDKDSLSESLTSRSSLIEQTSRGSLSSSCSLVEPFMSESLVLGLPSSEPATPHLSESMIQGLNKENIKKSLLQSSSSTSPPTTPDSIISGSVTPELYEKKITHDDTKPIEHKKKYSDKITSIKDPNWKKNFGQIMGEAIRTTSSINHHELRIKNIVDYLSNTGTKTLKDLFRPPPDCKDAILSSEYRAKGDYYYTMSTRNLDKKNLDHLENAHKYYTMSIAYAPINSIELSLGQANRSAVLFRSKLYNDCCNDIDRSIENGYPDELRAKLLLRKAMCYQILTPDDKSNIDKIFEDVYMFIEKMDKQEGINFRKIVDKQINIDPIDKSKFPIWNYDDNIIKLNNNINNKKINGLIEDIKLKYNDDYGRHIVAGKDMKPGDIIGIVEPYAKIHYPKMRYKFCSHCGIQTWSSIPCNYCPTIIFCSLKCYIEAQNEYHNIECPVFQSMRTIGLKNELFLIARTVAKAIKDSDNINDYQKQFNNNKINTDSLNKSFANETFNSKKFSNIYNYLGDPLDSQLKITIFAYPILLSYFFVTMTDNFCKRYSVDLSNLKHDPKFISLIILTQNIMQLINKNSITMMSYCDDDKIAMIHGLYPAINFFNQSSTPSMVSSLQGDKLILTAIQPIKKGKRIFFNCEQHNSVVIQNKQQIDYLDKYYLTSQSMVDNDLSSLTKNENLAMNVSASMINKLNDIKNKLNNIIWFIEHFEQTDGNVPDVTDVIKDAIDLIKKTTNRGKNSNEFLNDIFNTLEKFYQSYNSPCVKLSG